MRGKKKPEGGNPRARKESGRFSENRAKGTHKRYDPSIAIHRNGFMTSAPSARLQPNNKGAKRGNVVGWSRHSRRRLRKWMLTHEPAGSVIEHAVTLTVPGPSITPQEMRSLWKYASREFQRRGWSAVWRLELQNKNRIQPHWHMILHVPRPAHATGGGRVGNVHERAMLRWDFHIEVETIWKQALKQLGPCDHECTINGKRSLYGFNERWHIPGADEHSVNTQIVPEDQESQWRRYMQDHTSKAKQEQVAEGYGRHWGIIGRSSYRSSVPEHVERMEDAQYFRVVRWLQRLMSGTHRCDKAPFGRKRSRRSYRGSHGNSVWFTNTETVKRLIELAKATTPAK